MSRELKCRGFNVGRHKARSLMWILRVEAIYPRKRLSFPDKVLKTADIQKKSEYRIKRIMKSDLIVIDEIGYTPIEKWRLTSFLA